MSFYTWLVPKNTSRLRLGDGSILIKRSKPQIKPNPTIESHLPPRVNKLLPNQLDDFANENHLNAAKLKRKTDPATWTVGKLIQS